MARFATGPAKHDQMIYGFQVMPAILGIKMNIDEIVCKGIIGNTTNLNDLCTAWYECLPLSQQCFYI